MALGLGLGLPFSAGRGNWVPPQAGSLLWRLDPRRITASPVDVWPATTGTFSPTAAGGARPTWNGTDVDFNGTTHQLSQAASTATTSAAGSTKFTIAGWLRHDTLAVGGAVIETAAFATGVWLTSGAATLDFFVCSGAVVRYPSLLTAGAWTFLALSVDLSRANGSKCRIYRGAPTVVLQVPTTDNITITSTPAISGNAGISLSNKIDGAVGDWFYWDGIELTTPELQSVATQTNRV